MTGRDRTTSTDASSAATSSAPIPHGGNLREAATRYGVPLDAWIDLSTGINPCGYPVPPVPADAWRRLPEDGDGLAQHAARYYGAPSAHHVLPVAGSQAAIRALPSLLPRGSVGVASLTYGEYAPAFARAGHTVMPLDVAREPLLEALTHVIVANPNNPTATHLSRAHLLGWHAQLTARGGTLIVDEAFADVFAEPSLSSDGTRQHASIAAETYRNGLAVLRSPGKFFGLAGVRAGFVLAAPSMLAALRETLGAWTVSGPARHAVIAAFDDLDWQQQARAHLTAEGERLATLLRSHGFDVQGTPLFAWFADPRAEALQDALAQRGIWTRRFAAPASLRFGLPADEAQWQRLAEALDECMQTTRHPIR